MRPPTSVENLTLSVDHGAHVRGVVFQIAAITIYDTINTMQCNTTPMQYNNAMQCNAIQCNTIPILLSTPHGGFSETMMK